MAKAIIISDSENTQNQITQLTEIVENAWSKDDLKFTYNEETKRLTISVGNNNSK